MEQSNQPSPAPQETSLIIKGLGCASCVGRVESALKSVAGVTEASVNLATARAIIRGNAPHRLLIEAVRHAGYDATEISTGPFGHINTKSTGDDQKTAGGLFLAAMLTLPVFILDMGGHVFSSLAGTQGNFLSFLAQAIFTTLLLGGPGRPFFSKGLPALLRGAPDMNALVALGAGAAFLYSLVATFLPHILPANAVHVYYEASAMIVTLILFGRFLEAKARANTSSAIRNLLALRPATAHVRRGGEIIETPVDALAIDDFIELRPGERVPTDGLVIEGSSLIDESMITGEPIPVTKKAGDPVTGGTINQSGALVFRVSAVGKETFLANIIRIVEEAQAAKLPIQALVDKITLWFVPAVLLAALLTFSVWLVWGSSLAMAMSSAVAVLIVACPCAMGLATPTSIMVGTGRGAELGILFRKGDALQTLCEASVVALDKTGTLTEGKPVLTHFACDPAFDENNILALLASAEAKSEHPFARAIVAAASAKNLALPACTDFEAKAGQGLTAEVEGRRIHVGTQDFITRHAAASPALIQKADDLAADGYSPFFVSVDGAMAVTLAVSDTPKPSASEAINRLHKLGKKIVMLTGDHAGPAKNLGAQIGIDNVYAQLTPAAKRDALLSLAAQGHKIVFVGDGINDAPALAQADVGIAIGTGTDVAIESGDVILTSGDLRGVATAIALSRATLKNIRQNLFWAFFYNVAMIPLAAGFFYPSFGLSLSPVFAAGAMACSSLFVVGNALRLRSLSLKD